MCVGNLLQLLKYLDTIIKEEADRKWTPADEDGNTKVLSSANQLFLKIRASLQRCVKLVSKGQTLLGLSQAFKVGAAAILCCWTLIFPAAISCNATTTRLFLGLQAPLCIPVHPSVLSGTHLVADGVDVAGSSQAVAP